MKMLTAAAIAWPVLLASVVLARQHGQAPLWTMAVYAIGSKICHQIPARSFHVNGVQWPVCARCLGLYLSAPFGAVATLVAHDRAIRGDGRLWRLGSWPLLILTAIPTALTLAIEWSGWGAPSNAARALSALPLGAAIAFLVVRAAAGLRRHRVN
jgi:uncharacterized membrane protein